MKSFLLLSVFLCLLLSSPSAVKAIQLDDTIDFLSEFGHHMDQVQCLSEAIYFEARGESISGQTAVAHVTINRVISPAFPHDVCAVVRFQNSSGVCAFSWVCDGPRIQNHAAFERAFALAVRIYNERLVAGINSDNTQGSTHFHNDTITESPWAGYKETVVIGRHTFYKRSRG